MTINSSDDNTSPRPRGCFATAGQTNINDIIDHAMEDKISSNKEVKALNFSLGRPRAQDNGALWSNRFEAFWTVLGDDLTVPPSGQDIKRRSWGCLNFNIHSFLSVEVPEIQKSRAQWYGSPRKTTTLCEHFIQLPLNIINASSNLAKWSKNVRGATINDDLGQEERRWFHQRWYSDAITYYKSKGFAAQIDLAAVTVLLERGAKQDQAPPLATDPSMQDRPNTNSTHLTGKAREKAKKNAAKPLKK